MSFKRFWSLPLGADFYIGKHLYFKWNWFLASPATFGPDRKAFVLPWRKVRTTERLFAKVNLAEMESRVIAAYLRDSVGEGKSFRTLRDEAIDRFKLSENAVFILGESSGLGIALPKPRTATQVNEDRRDALLLALHAANAGKTLAYAEELHRRYPVKGTHTGRHSMSPRVKAIFNGVRPYDEAKLMNMEFNHEGNIQPHKDDERTGPSA